VNDNQIHEAMTSLQQNFPWVRRWRDTPTTHTANSDLYQGSYTMLVMHGTLYRLLYHFSGLATIMSSYFWQ